MFKRLAKYGLVCRFFVLLASGMSLVFGSALAQSVDGFDIKGMRLGMSKEEISAAYPQLKFPVPNRNFGPGNVSRYDNRAGNGMGMVADWNAEAHITDSPYGSGAYFLHYKHLLNSRGRVHPSIFLANFKSDLVNKYGKPKYEITRQDENYFACWGDGCNKDLVRLNLHANDISGVGYAVQYGNLSPGKYLIAAFRNDALVQEILLTLLDSKPVSLGIDEVKKSELRRSQEKRIQF